MIIKTFPDGSTIETDVVTGYRTVVGEMAHTEYFKRLREERITQDTSPAIIDYCRNYDGTRKCELIRKTITNPLTREMFGEYAYEVWSAEDPNHVVRYTTFEKASEAFKNAMDANESPLDGNLIRTAIEASRFI